MLYNEYLIKKDINGHVCIEIINPDYVDEGSFNKYWHDLIFALKDIIPCWEMYEGSAYTIWINDSISIETLYGRMEITRNQTDRLGALDNFELIDKISSLLEKSGVFFKRE
jgi:hypothetical protein